MLELTKVQIQQVIEVQAFLENEILGRELDSKEYVLWTWGGRSNFYKKNLWGFLGLEDFATMNEEIEMSQEIFGATNSEREDGE